MTDGTDSVLAQVAREYPIEELIRRVRGMRSLEVAGRSEEERLRAAANVNQVVEIAAEAREPAGVAEFAIALSSCGERGLAAHALDVASASRAPGDLARLATDLDRGDLAGTLLSAMIRRRLPRDVAAVLCRLADMRQAGLVERVLAGLVETRRAQDAVYAVLALRTHRRDELARELSGTMATRLDPAELARFVVGLRDHEDRVNVSHAIETALGREVGEVADLIRQLFESGQGQYAHSVLDEAVRRLVLADKLVLASLLQKDLPPEVASAIWANGTRALEGSLVDALDPLEQQAGPTGVHRALQEAAKVHSIELINELVRHVHLKADEGGVDTVFDTVVRCRSIGEIGELSDRLRGSSYADLARRLLELVIERIHERDDVGDAAALIHLLLTQEEETKLRRRGRGQRDSWRWHDHVPGIITSIARRRGPEHLMGLIDGLVGRQRYGEHSKLVKTAVAREYDAEKLASLPKVRKGVHLPEVLQLMYLPLQSPKSVSSAEIPVVISALKEAGARPDDLRKLLEHVGYQRHLDHYEIVAALQQAELRSDAEAVLSGRRKGRL